MLCPILRNNQFTCVFFTLLPSVPVSLLSHFMAVRRICLIEQPVAVSERCPTKLKQGLYCRYCVANMGIVSVSCPISFPKTPICIVYKSTCIQCRVCIHVPASMSVKDQAGINPRLLQALIPPSHWASSVGLSPNPYNDWDN